MGLVPRYHEMQEEILVRSKIRIAAIALAVLVAAAVSASALSNLGLPTHSETFERLSAAEKARLAEAFHLRETLGDRVWAGWGDAEIPVIASNEAHAFLVGYPEDEDPPAGWVRLPHDEGGFAQAMLLDRLVPDWKDQIWSERVWLEDLLAEAVPSGVE